MKNLLFLLLFLFTFVAFSQDLPALKGVEWHNTDRSYTWESLQGKVVLLDFWGVWCKPCVDAIPKLEKLDEALYGENFQILTIHTPKRSENLKSQFAEYGYNFITMVDEPQKKGELTYYGKTTTAFQVKAFPSYILIDSSGKIIGDIRSVPPSLEEIQNLIR